MAEPAIVVDLPDVKLLFGKNAAIDILIDGRTAGSIKFGERASFACSSGTHDVRALLQTALPRKSNALRVTVPADGVANLRCTYSRIWGNLKLRSA
jgi:hypothetical protein